MNADGFEIDKTTSGRIKVNVVSVANLIGVLALLGAAIGTWTTITSQVNTMQVRIENATSSIADLRQSINSQTAARDGNIHDLQSSMSDLKTRMAVVESVLSRLDKKIGDNPSFGHHDQP